MASSVIDHASVLTILGNESLRECAGGAPPPLLTAKFDGPPRFTRSNSPHSEDISTDTLSEWFSILHKDGVKGLRLRHAPVVRDRKELSAISMPGTGRWLIEAVGESYSEYWDSVWSFGRRWQVEYAYAPIDPAILDPILNDLSSISMGLERALVRIADYARRSRLAPFASVFDRGVEHLGTDLPLRPIIYTDYRADLDGCQVLSPAAKRLFSAARSGLSVFGGMGAWNDRSKEERTEEYIDVTEKLGQMLTAAMIAAVNSSFDPAPVRN